jgi:hypothetical protein
MSHFLSADAVADFDGVILDCRFSLADAAAGLRRLSRMGTCLAHTTWI